MFLCLFKIVVLDVMQDVFVPDKIWPLKEKKCKQTTASKDLKQKQQSLMSLSVELSSFPGFWAQRGKGTAWQLAFLANVFV